DHNEIARPAGSDGWFHVCRLWRHLRAWGEAIFDRHPGRDGARVPSALRWHPPGAGRRTVDHQVADRSRRCPRGVFDSPTAVDHMLDLRIRVDFPPSRAGGGNLRSHRYRRPRQPEFRLSEAVLLAALLAALSAGVFVYGLGIPLPVWPTIRL